VTWVKLDDGFTEHPKVAGLSDAAFRLHVNALCWCARRETDGVVPATVRKLLGATPKLIAELVAAGLWEETEGGHELHDYLEYNPSKAQLDAQREQTRTRVQKFRERVGNGTGNGVTRTVGNAVGTPAPVPGPVPVPDPLLDPVVVDTRPESHPATEAKPAVAAPRPASARKPRREDSIPVPMSDAIEIPADLVAAKAAQWQVDEARIRAQIPEFRRFWAQDRPSERKAPKGWRAAFGYRVDDLGKRGLLHGPQLQQVLGVQHSRGTRAADLIPNQLERIRRFEAEEEAERKSGIMPLALPGGAR
jgi:hypothetical protein